jgi:hypothetical protein
MLSAFAAKAKGERCPTPRPSQSNGCTITSHPGNSGDYYEPPVEGGPAASQGSGTR